MRIGFVVTRPTQFEAPFYRFVQNADPENKLDVFFLNEYSNSYFDKETDLNVKWGSDLYEGYSCFFLNSENKCSDFIKYLKIPYSLMIINGYKNQYKGFAEICKSLNIPVALRMDTVLFNQSRFKIMLRKLFLTSVYSRFDHFMVTGKVSKDYLTEMGIRKEKVSVFSYCIDNDFFKLRKRTENPFQTILVVAKFIERESPLDVIKAFRKLNRKDLRLVIAGEGKERSLLEKEAGKWDGNRIIFTGFIDYDQLPHYYSSSSLFIHTARNEPWGVSVQEAIAAGCRIICSDRVGSAHDLIYAGKNGYMYRCGHPSELADLIEQVLKIPSELVNQTNQEILGWWNFNTMWTEILSASQAVCLRQTIHLHQTNPLLPGRDRGARQYLFYLVLWVFQYLCRVSVLGPGTLIYSYLFLQ